jgi:hypothetical protein
MVGSVTWNVLVSENTGVTNFYTRNFVVSALPNERVAHNAGVVAFRIIEGAGFCHLLLGFLSYL